MITQVMKVAVGLTLIVLGFLCLNYTKGFDMDHHVQWAKEHGMPGPTYPMFLLGSVMEVLGSGLVGHVIGRRSKSQIGGSA